MTMSHTDVTAVNFVFTFLVFPRDPLYDRIGRVHVGRKYAFYAETMFLLDNVTDEHLKCLQDLMMAANIP